MPGPRSTASISIPRRPSSFTRRSRISPLPAYFRMLRTSSETAVAIMRLGVSSKPASREYRVDSSTVRLASISVRIVRCSSALIARPQASARTPAAGSSSRSASGSAPASPGWGSGSGSGSGWSRAKAASRLMAARRPSTSAPASIRAETTPGRRPTSTDSAPMMVLIVMMRRRGGEFIGIECFEAGDVEDDPA